MGSKERRAHLRLKHTVVGHVYKIQTCMQSEPLWDQPGILQPEKMTLYNWNATVVRFDYKGAPLISHNHLHLEKWLQGLLC